MHVDPDGRGERIEWQREDEEEDELCRGALPEVLRGGHGEVCLEAQSVEQGHVLDDV